MSEKAIVVSSKGKSASGVVTEKDNVHFATPNELDGVISAGLLEVANILSGEVEDPTKKKCSRCIKMGRYPFHKVDDFSLLLNGKRHSQCKVCRTEQAVAWEASRKEHRKAYHKDYNKTRTPAVRIPKALKNFAAAMTEAESGVNGREALFIASPQTEVESTDVKN